MALHYVTPKPAELRALKESLGYTGEEMAELFQLGGSHQWRKYTGGEQPRDMSLHMLLFGAMHLELDEATLRRVYKRAVAMGGRFPDLFNDDEVRAAVEDVRASEPKRTAGVE